MTKLPKITKANYNQILPTCKKNQIVKFSTSISQDDIHDMATEHGLKVEFFEPSTTEFKLHGRNVCKLYR